jgi:hypothetical protein
MQDLAFCSRLLPGGIVSRIGKTPRKRQVVAAGRFPNAFEAHGFPALKLRETGARLPGAARTACPISLAFGCSVNGGTTGGQVNVVLIGQNFIAATPDRGSVAGGYAAAGIDWQIGRFTLFAAGEGIYTNEMARIYSGKGGVRVTW